jgi:hypothetical protein
MTICAKQISQAMILTVKPFEMTIWANGFLLSTLSFRLEGEICASGLLKYNTSLRGFMNEQQKGRSNLP